MRFHSYHQFKDHLHSLGLFRMTPGLERMDRFTAALGASTPVGLRVQVVGTNGKGSTCAYLAALAQAHGLRTGLYASPHFVSVRERIRLDGAMLTREEWLGLANRVYALCPDTDFSYFELLTCMAHLLFTENPPDVAVLETGLGGTYDAVTALPVDLTVFTPMALDHCAVLGKTLAQVARDKAGAVRPGVPVVGAAQASEPREILELAAQDAGSPLHWAEDLLAEAGFGPDFPDAPAIPRFMRLNARTALAAWITLCRLRGLAPDPDACCSALAGTVVPGRMQVVPGEPGLILDGAHNPHGLAALKIALDEAGMRPGALVFACMADKDVDAMTALAQDMTDGPVFVPALGMGGRAMDARALAGLMGPRAAAFADPASAMDAAERAALDRSGPVLAAGSLYLLAEIYTKHPWLLGSGTFPDPEAEPKGE